MGLGHNFLTPQFMVNLGSGSGSCVPPAVNLGGPWVASTPPTSTSAPNTVFYGDLFTPLPLGTSVTIDLSEFFTGGPITHYTQDIPFTGTGFTFSGGVFSGVVSEPNNDALEFTAHSACGAATILINLFFVS